MSQATDIAQPAPDAASASVMRNRPLITLALGHLTIDLYAGLLPVLFPLLAREYDLSLATVGLIALAYSGMGSISQPSLVGILDRGWLWLRDDRAHRHHTLGRS